MNRRNFLRLGIGAAIAAPALVSRANIMAIKVPRRPVFADWLEEVLFPAADERWMIIHPDRYRDLRLIGVDHGSPEGDKTGIVRGIYNERGEIVIGEIDRFRVYITPNLVASNYGRGPGQLRENALGMRSWHPEPSAVQILRKQRQAERAIRAMLEPHRSKRWV